MVFRKRNLILLCFSEEGFETSFEERIYTVEKVLKISSTSKKAFVKIILKCGLVNLLRVSPFFPLYIKNSSR